jgi:hypothetical protein
MNPRYPIFIPTKGRWETPYTIRAFTKIGVPFKAVVEPQQFDNYAAVIGAENILVLPHSDKGLVVTRNWIWDYAQDLGVARFWTFDDNIRDFFRLTNNIKYRVTSGTFLCVIEDFVERYENVPIAGMNYEMFVQRKVKHPPLILNTRVYSNMLIQTDVRDRHGKPFRNEGFYNDDTDLCLRVLKSGLCIVQFNAFLADKIATMQVKGGMTPHYQGDGRWKMAEELRQKHPDVVKVVRKWGRWQHQVDYRPFKHNRLKRKPGVVIPDEPNEYGMVLVKREAA